MFESNIYNTSIGDERSPALVLSMPWRLFFGVSRAKILSIPNLSVLCGELFIGCTRLAMVNGCRVPVVGVGVGVALAGALVPAPRDMLLSCLLSFFLSLQLTTT